MSKEKQKNVFGETLEPCSNEPLTGWLRDGCCNTDKNDRGVHTCLLYTSPSPRDVEESRMPSSA